MSFILRISYRLSPRLGKILRVMQILLARRGYWQSLVQGLPVDAQSGPLPWMTYPAIDHLSRLDFSGADVLEYGCGNSSLWWAARAAQVTSVEGRAEWATQMRAKAPANLQILGPLEGEDYIHQPLTEGRKFQVIVVDGFDRHECCQAALPHLAEGGMLLLDNSDWHGRTCQWLGSQGLVQIDFHGLGPLNDYAWCTSLFIRATSALPYQQKPWPAELYGTLEQTA